MFWPSIDQAHFKSLCTEVLSIPFFVFYLSSRSAYLSKDCDREIIDLCLVILGTRPPTPETDEKSQVYHFRVPHQAGWMMKVIYCFKIFLFREKFTLVARETKALTEFCLFTAYVQIYFLYSCLHNFIV